MNQEPNKKIPYSNPALTIDQQVTLLKEKELIVADEQSASFWLSHISYFRFKQYSYSFKDYENHDGHYIEGTTFEMIRDLYTFDRKLRMILFEAIENIEISVKTAISNIMTIAHGPHWYMDANLFFSEEERRQIVKNAKAKEDIPVAFEHAEFLNDVEYETKYRPEIYLQHYYKTYTPSHPPSWIMMEIITFGTLSNMIENMKPSDQKNAICESFGLTKKHFVSWMHSFSFIRNKCAHHARLVFAKINFAPSLPQKKSRQFLNEADLVENDTLYAVIACAQYMLRVCNPASAFKKDILKLADTYTMIDYEALGFTPEWRSDPFWTE